MTPSLQPRWGSTRNTTPTAVKTKPRVPVVKTNLSDDELRKRIFANAAVLFPSSPTQQTVYEIVYGSHPAKPTFADTPDPYFPAGEQPPPGSEEQYAMLVRRLPSGEFTPLLKGQSMSTERPWSLVLQVLLEATAHGIHKKLGNRRMPPLGVSENLPVYSERSGASSAEGLSQQPVAEASGTT